MEMKGMQLPQATVRLAALGHETRLAIFRLLVRAGPQGLNAGAIGQELEIALPTLSFHLAHLSRVGLITGRQESRFIFYAADYDAMNELIGFLTENCCQGRQCLPSVPAAAAKTRRRAGAARTVRDRAVVDRLPGRERTR
ncbi:MAG: ArsR/SmtB family transcription factor [Burkholderiales bacterium]